MKTFYLEIILCLQDIHIFLLFAPEWEGEADLVCGLGPGSFFEKYRHFKCSCR